MERQSPLPPAALDVSRQLRVLDPASDQYATEFVDMLLKAGEASRASDLHLQPTADGLQVRWRIDGVLQTIGNFSRGVTADPINRLKVLAELLTYRQDLPQEGRIRRPDGGVEVRVSTFPTLHGERAAVRLLSSGDAPWFLDDLGLPNELKDRWHACLKETSGGLIICGPAGSGKTTTAYASLRQIVADSDGGRNVVSLEDPVEAEVAGVAQSNTNEASGLTLTSGLKSLLRQDPEVILLGEMRDPLTAEIAFQAALTGQLMLTTFHAGSAAEAISRLSDMGLEPYVLRSGVVAVLFQRLVRRLCQCKSPVTIDSEKLGFAVDRAWQATGCDRCLGTGYRGRAVLAELLLPRAMDLSESVDGNVDANSLEKAAMAAGMKSRWQQALTAIKHGITSPQEVRRVLGFGSATNSSPSGDSDAT